MDDLYSEQLQFSSKGLLKKSIEDIDVTLSLFDSARQSITDRPDGASIFLVKLQNPVRSSFESSNSSLKDVHKTSQTYSKTLDKRLKAKQVTVTGNAGLSSDALLDRAISMHLLREGQFEVATAFMGESLKSTHLENLSNPVLKSITVALEGEFRQMYHILQEMKGGLNLKPAMEWAKSRADVLQARGSNLEFELARMQFIWLFSGACDRTQTIFERRKTAIMYARQVFSNLGTRYTREIQQLIGAMAFAMDLESSPYNQLFQSTGAWEEVAISFAREFCSSLGLSADSPLFIAATAGAMALPMLEKLRTIMKEKRTEWTTEHELPVEIPLPPSYHFHPIFVCPVSKEQTTDQNPPMMLPCGHVIARESLARLSKMAKFKCPYCPTESHFKDAKIVVL